MDAEELLKRFWDDLDAGLPVEEVVDKYVRCATPELRQQLIDGLREIIGRRMIEQTM